MYCTTEGVNFKWKNQNDNTNYTGFIAQEVQKVIPEMVSEREDGYLSVSSAPLIPIFVEALKEQQNQINQVQQELCLKDNYSWC